MTWFTQIPTGVQYTMIAAVAAIFISALVVFYKSKFKIKSGDKEIDKEAPEDDGETK